MSASREKKQRQQVSQEVKVSRAQEEQANAAKRKRNTIIYSIIGAVAVVLAAALLIWDSGVIQRNYTVGTVDGEKVTGAQVAFYYYSNGIIRNAKTYDQYGMAGFPYTTTKSPKDQTITEDAADTLSIDEKYVGKTYHELFMDDALTSLKRESALLAAAKQAGYTLSDEGAKAVEAEIDSLDDILDQYLAYYGADMTKNSYLQSIYGKSMSVKLFEKCLERAQLADEFYAENFDTLANYSDSEMNTYYEANKAALNTVEYYFRIFDGTPATTDEDGKSITPTEEDTKAAMDAAKAAADKAKAEVDANPDSVKDNKDYTFISGVPAKSGLYYEWLTDAARKSGDSTVISNDVGYILVIFVDSYRDDTPTADVRHVLVSAMPEDDKSTENVDESKNAPTDADYDAAKKKAQDMLDKWISEGSSADAFAELAKKNSADMGSASNGGLYEDVHPGQMIEEFNNWLFEDGRKAGDTGLIKNTESTTKGWHIVYYVGQNELSQWELMAREALWNADIEKTVTFEATDKLNAVID